MVSDAGAAVLEGFVPPPDTPFMKGVSTKHLSQEHICQSQSNPKFLAEMDDDMLLQFDRDSSHSFHVVSPTDIFGMKDMASAQCHINFDLLCTHRNSL